MEDCATKIVNYDNDILRPFLSLVKAQYDDSKIVNIPYKIWMERFLNITYNNPEIFKLKTYKGEQDIRVINSTSLFNQYKEIEPQIIKMKEESIDNPELQESVSNRVKELIENSIKPDYEFTYPGVEYYEGNPIWFGRTIKDLKMFVGPEELDLSKPYCLTIGDDNVHSNAQGITGGGKTVLIHELIFNLLLMYPPWELDLMLIDHKMAEMHVYGNLVKTPHCDVIAITNAKEYIIDLYRSISEENKRRQQIFSSLNVNGVESLREKYNLILPTKLLIVDELVYQLITIDDTVNDGNDNASSEKKELFASMAKVATQGRNAKVHMFISSQDLGDQLDKTVADQIGSGIALRGGPQIAKGCIGNTCIDRLDRKGLCICNQDRKSANNESNNVLVGIPFIKMSLPKGDPASPHTILSHLAKTASKYNFNKSLDYYDAKLLISPRIYEEELKTCKIQMSDNILNTQCLIPLGKQISYTDPKIIRCELTYKRGDGFFIDSYDVSSLVYMFNIIRTAVVDQLGQLGLTTNVYSIASTTKEVLGLDSTKDDVNFFATKEFPTKPLLIYRNRAQVLEFDRWFNKNLNTPKLELFLIVSQLKGYSQSLTEDTIKDYLEGKEITNDVQSSQLRVVESFFDTYCNLRTQGIEDENGLLSPCVFKPILNYWFDMQECENLVGREKLNEVADYFSNSPKVNFINVVNCSTWQNDKFTSALEGSCRYVLERSTVQTFKALGLGQYTANVNSDSLILHDRLKKGTVFYTKNFGGI